MDTVRKRKLSIEHEAKRTTKRWIRRGKKIVYQSLFIPKKDSDVRNSVSMKCKYAGFEVHDMLIVEKISSTSDRRWKAVGMKCLGKVDNIYAPTKAMLLEKIDGRWIK